LIKVLVIFVVLSISSSLNTLKSESKITSEAKKNESLLNTKAQANSASLTEKPKTESQKNHKDVKEENTQNEKTKKVKEFLSANKVDNKESKERATVEASKLMQAANNSTLAQAPVPENKYTSTYPGSGEKPFNITVPKDFYSTNDDQPELTQTAKEKLRFFFEPVQYVKEISPSGKASIKRQELGDPEYEALLEKGFETPKIIEGIIADKTTKVAAPMDVNSLWKGTDYQDQHLWENVEFNRFNNPQEMKVFQTPARYRYDGFGSRIVTAPSNSRMMIEATTPTIFKNSYFSVAEDYAVEDFASDFDVPEMMTSSKH